MRLGHMRMLVYCVGGGLKLRQIEQEVMVEHR